jgi:hypothetical protein
LAFPATEEILFKSSILACASLLAFASVASAETARPMFAVLKHNLAPNSIKPLTTPNWNFTWTYNAHNYSVTFIGTKPSVGGTTNVTVHVIPAKFVVGSFTADPSAKDSHGKSVIDYTLASPLFDKTTDYKQGKVDLGATQYEDAVERLNIWGQLKKNKTNYHIILNPVLETGLTYTNPSGATVKTDFGVQVVNYDINAWDSSIQSTVKKFPAADLVLFMTTQLYLTSGGGCCIGGYHSYTGTQAYSQASFITNPTQVFGWDVSALSHELGEWMNDPATNNSNSPCFYETGDPLEGGQPGHQYGQWNYTVGGVVYHLQDLVTPVYFGAPKKTSANKWWTFQGFKFTTVCQNGG